MSDENKTQGKGMFGITKDTKATNASPLLTATKVEGNAQFPSGWKFPIANLVNVIANPALEKKDGSTSAVLQFVFKDGEGRQHTHTEWEVDENDAKLQDKVGYMNVRIKHIYVSIFGKFPEAGIGANASTFAEFFQATADAFNNIVTGEEKKKVYPKVALYYKLVAFNGRLNFPLAPNFLEKVSQNKPCTTLTINPRYDKLELKAEKASSGIAGIGGGMTDVGDDMPAFGESYE